MNLRISALEKVARIGCKYDLSFLLYSFWALPSVGFAEGQLALRPLVFRFLKMWTLMIEKCLSCWCWDCINVTNSKHRVRFKTVGQLSEPLHVLR